MSNANSNQEKIVLLVDDDVFIRESMSELLYEEGYSVL
jgi:FixJ family two-component response regulator